MNSPSQPGLTETPADPGDGSALTPATASTGGACGVQRAGCCWISRALRIVIVLLALLVVGAIGVRYTLLGAGDGGVGASNQLNQSREAVKAITGQPDVATDENVGDAETTGGNSPSELADKPAGPPPHPLDPALKLARDGLERIERDVVDYTARVTKRERIDGVLGEEQQMFLKFRCRKLDGETVVTPMAVYMKFLEPRSVAGREVIWVEGYENGRLIAHEAGFLNLARAKLDPDGPLAMAGQRYPIYKIGVQNLVEELIIKGEEDKKHGDCEVNIVPDQEIAGRKCRMLEMRHDDQRPEYAFHIARIWIDDELELPLRYAAWSWPTEPGGEPVLEEDYTYAELKINVSLTDDDFDPDNPEYKFPALGKNL